MAAVNHFYVEELTVKTNSSTSFTNDADSGSLPTISGGDLLANTTYLIIARGMFGGNDTNDLFKLRVITADDTLIAAKSEIVIEPTHGGTNTGHPYFFVHEFDTSATPTDVEFEFLTNDGANAVHLDQASLFLMDLDDLGSSNYFSTISADPGVTTDLYPTSLADEWTIAGSDLGTDEFVVFAYQRTQLGTLTHDYVVEPWGAFDSSTYARRGKDQQEGENAGELRISGFALRHKASSGTPDFAIRTTKSGGNFYDRGGYGIALLASAFADFPAPGYTAASTTLDGTERTMETIASYSPTTTADHLLFGMYTQDDVNAGNWCRLHIEDDTVEMRVGDQTSFVTNNYDSASEPQATLFHMDNILSSDTSTYTLRATAAASNTAKERWLLFLSLELADAGPVLTPFDLIAKKTGTAPDSPLRIPVSRLIQSEVVVLPPVKLLPLHTGTEIEVPRPSQTTLIRSEVIPALTALPLDHLVHHTGTDFEIPRPPETVITRPEVILPLTALLPSQLLNRIGTAPELALPPVTILVRPDVIPPLTALPPEHLILRTGTDPELPLPPASVFTRPDFIPLPVITLPGLLRTGTALILAPLSITQFVSTVFLPILIQPGSETGRSSGTLAADRGIDLGTQTTGQSPVSAKTGKSPSSL